MAGKDLGIDLGTANILIHVKGKGIMVNEPTVVAVDQQAKTVVAVGKQAKEMIGRTPGNIVALRPLRDGVIADFDGTQAMLKHCISRACEGMWFGKPRIVICVPSGVTEVEKRAVEEAVIGAGAKEAYLIEEPMAAAIGAGLPVEQPTGCMVVDIGGGTTEVAVLSLGGIVTCVSLRVAGDAMDRALVNYLKKVHQLLIGERTGEQIKLCIGSAMPLEREEQTEAIGRDVTTGMPKTICINSIEVRQALLDPLLLIADALRATLEKTPPELASDIMDRGITLTGGGALLRGIAPFLSQQTGLSVYVAEDPLDCVALGTAHALSELNTLRRVLVSTKAK